MKICLILLLGMLSGCSTIARLAEVEGSGKAGEYIRDIDSARVIMGGRPSNRDVAAVVNRTAGETYALTESLDSTTLSNAPQRIQRFGYILENVTR